MSGTLPRTRAALLVFSLHLLASTFSGADAPGYASQPGLSLSTPPASRFLQQMTLSQHIPTARALSTLLVLGAGTAMGQTTLSGTAGSADSWNDASNWNAGIPSGGIDAIIAPGVWARVDNAATASYTGSLTLGDGAVLTIAGAVGSESAAKGVASITMGAGSEIQVNVNADIPFPPITLLGDATLSSLFGASDWQIDNFGPITGAHTLTLAHFNGHTVNLNAANGFAELILDTVDRWNLNARAAGSLGTGNVTINPRSSDGRSASLFIDVDNVMADTATLTLNGSPGQGGFSGTGSDYVVMNANDTIGKLYVYGVQQPEGVYTSAEAWLSGAGTLTVQASAVGVNYCGPANFNSSGGTALIAGWGSDAALDNSLTLVASGMPVNELGYFLCSQTQGFVSGPGNSAGNLCLGGKLGRFVSQVQSTGAMGEFAIPVDLSGLPVWRHQAALAGETWNFQAWFKDGASSNFSDGLSISFL